MPLASYQECGYGLAQTAAPAEEPVTRAEAKEWLLIEQAVTALDAKVDALIRAARESVENLYSRQLVTATWRMTLPSFGSYSREPIRLPRGPVQSVTGVAYLDYTTGLSTTLSPSLYQVSVLRDPCLVTPADGQAWPANVKANALDAVTVTFVAGYGTAAAVPEVVKAAIKMCAMAWLEYPLGFLQSGGGSGRPREVPQNVEWLLAQIWNGSYG